jgi:transketolase
MLNNLQKLNPKLFELAVEQVPVRKGYGEGLLEAGKLDEKIVALCADLTESTQTHLFAKEFPKRFVQMGVAEQNLAAVASGMAAMGKIPFITSYAMFSPGRNWEQIRTTICYNDRPVKVVGSHAGVSVGPDGGTHQAIEDIAIMRVIPKMEIVVPCDHIEAKKATLEIAKTSAPTYLRLAREKTPVITTEATPFVPGRANILWHADKPQVAIIACGPVVYNTLVAAKRLADEGINVTVTNMHTIKPLDTETVLKVATEAGKVVTVEEHQVAGGLGSAVAEYLAEHKPVPMQFVGVRDQFGQSGTQPELIEHYNLGISDIIEAVKKIIKK